MFGIIKPPNCSNVYVDRMVGHINDIVQSNQHCNFFPLWRFNFPSFDWKIPCAFGNNSNENKFFKFSNP